jgi:hypothetical protein
MAADVGRDVARLPARAFDVQVLAVGQAEQDHRRQHRPAGGVVTPSFDQDDREFERRLRKLGRGDEDGMQLAGDREIGQRRDLAGTMQGRIEGDRAAV